MDVSVQPNNYPAVGIKVSGRNFQTKAKSSPAWLFKGEVLAFYTSAIDHVPSPSSQAANVTYICIKILEINAINSNKIFFNENINGTIKFVDCVNVGETIRWPIGHYSFARESKREPVTSIKYSIPITLQPLQGTALSVKRVAKEEIHYNETIAKGILRENEQ